MKFVIITIFIVICVINISCVQQSQYDDLNKSYLVEQQELEKANKEIARLNASINGLKEFNKYQESVKEELFEIIKLYRETYGFINDIGDIDKTFDKGTIKLKNNPQAINTTWNRLCEFVLSDTTDKLPYIKDKFMCGDYANTLYNQAEAAKINTAIVILSLSDDSFHALNAFNTVDKGLVFIDCTGTLELSLQVNKLSILDKVGTYNDDKIAYVNKGKPYGLIQLTSSNAKLLNPNSYEFYKNANYETGKQYGYIGIVKEVYLYW